VESASAIGYNEPRTWEFIPPLPTVRDPTLLRGDEWPLREPEPTITRYAPEYARHIMMLPHQLAVFPRRDAALLVAGYAVRLLTRREYSLAAMLAIVGIVLLGRIVVVGKTLNLAELAALGISLPLAAVMIAMRDHWRVAVLAALLTAAIIAQGIAPFDLLSQPHAFSWMPFRSSLRGGLETNYSALLEKSFWYGSLVWLLARGGWSLLAATVGTAALVAAIEIVQMWLPGRSADVTDVLLVLAAGFLLAIPRERVGAPAQGVAPRYRTTA
jgi:hypothetical protein